MSFIDYYKRHGVEKNYIKKSQLLMYKVKVSTTVIYE